MCLDDFTDRGRLDGAAARSILGSGYLPLRNLTLGAQP